MGTFPYEWSWCCKVFSGQSSSLHWLEEFRSDKVWIWVIGRILSGIVWFEGVWSGMVWFEGVWSCMVWFKGLWSGMVWLEGVWTGMVWLEGVWTGMVWCARFCSVIPRQMVATNAAACSAYLLFFSQDIELQQNYGVYIFSKNLLKIPPPHKKL